MRDNFGLWLKKLREDNKISQAQMADLLGFKNSQSIAMLENNSKILPIQYWEPLCKLFKINLKSFINDMYYITLAWKADSEDK